MVERVDPHALAGKLGLTLVESVTPGVNGHTRGGGPVAQATTPVGGVPVPVENLATYPSVVAALGKVTGDRSADIARVVGACYDASLTLDEARWTAGTRMDLAAKLAEFRHDDVRRLWDKIDDERRKRVRSETWADVDSFAPATDDNSSSTDQGGGAVERSWRPVDLELVLSGEWAPARPDVGRRNDDVGMFYRGKVHSVSSESEGLKTWLLLVVTVLEIRAGNHVLFIDFEDDEAGVVGRLLALQLSPELVRSHFHYVRPIESVNSMVNLNDLAEIVTTYRPTLAIIDGITEAMTMHGLNPLDNQDIATFGRMLPRRLARAGCATVCLDHVVKDAESRGRYALGGVHKLNAVDGAAYLLEGRDPFGIGLTGRSAILIAKDRPGQLRKHGRQRKDKLFEFGELVLTSHHESYVEYEVRPPDGAAPSEFRPTALMGKICAALVEHGPMAQRAILATVTGKRQYAIDALVLLQRDGYVSDTSPHKLLKAWDGQ
jgi:hypothetical protein